MKNRRFILLFIFFLALPINRSFAYWGGEGKAGNDLALSQGELIGRWYYMDPLDSGAPEVVYFDVNNLPDTNIAAGSIIVYTDAEGVLTIFTALKNVNPNRDGFDPGTMSDPDVHHALYAEDTAEYRGFHYYSQGDYTIYNGRLYRWLLKKDHVPKKDTQIAPDNPNCWGEVSLPEGISLDELWYRHKIYLEDKIVWYQGQYYRAVLAGRSGYYPDFGVVWEPVY